jgi:hypothetical protein
MILFFSFQAPQKKRKKRKEEEKKERGSHSK